MKKSRASRTPKKTVTSAGYSDAVKASALVAYAKHGAVKFACEAVKIGRRTWYDWIEADPAFGARVLEVSEEVTDELEAEAVKRAKDGSDTLLIFLLKSKRRAEYGDRQTIAVVSPDVKARLARQIQVITATLDPATATSLLNQLDEVWS